MATRSSKRVIYAAIAGNLAIAVTKFVAAAVTGSSAMISEGVHSLIDTGNGLLLLHGIREGQSLPDETHPFGRGKELYFWTLIVAILIFAVGGGISIFAGFIGVLHPPALEDPSWNYAVLCVAAIFESATWTIALLEFRKVKGQQGYWEAIRASKDPTTFTVLVEDSMALLGLVVAFLGIFLARALDMPRIDGVAAILIGIMLAVVGIFLAYKSKTLLVGESVDPQTLASIRELAQADPAVARLARALTMHFGPNDVLLTMEIQFRPELGADDVAAAIERVDRAIRLRHPEVRLIFLESQSLAGPARKSAGKAAGKA